MPRSIVFWFLNIWYTWHVDIWHMMLSQHNHILNRKHSQNTHSSIFCNNSWMPTLINSHPRMTRKPRLTYKNNRNLKTISVSKSVNVQTTSFLKVCYDIIKKSQTQEKVLVSRSRSPNTENIEATATPPPPILVFRSSSRITLRPAPFKPLCQKKVIIKIMIY